MKKLDKKYIEINIVDFYKFLNDEKLANIIKSYFMDHHCAVYNKNNYFVFERYFTADELECEDYEEEIMENGLFSIIDEDDEEIEIVIEKEKDSEKLNIPLITLQKLKEYLKSQGYSPYPGYVEKRKANDKSIVPGYSGILFDVNW